MTSQLISYLNTGSATNGFSKCKPAGAGEGYHAGYINFNTHYGTALQVISIFTGKGGDAARFNAFLPTLNANIATHKDSVAGLEGFCDAWRAVAKDSSSLFKDAQTYVVNGLYGSIAKARAEARSVQLSITKAALLDIAIVNGIRSGKDIFEDIVSGADAASFFVDSSVPGAKMKINGKDVDEISWLNELLKKWEKVNPAAQPHVKVFRELISTGHHSFDSKQPLTVDRGSGSVTIGGAGDGYYAGYINFSTKYGSVVQVIDEFMRSGGSGTQFGPLLDKLRAYAATGNGSVVGLDGFCGAWNTTAAANPGTFLKAQTTVVNRVYVNGKEFDEIIWINALLKKWESVNPSAMPHIQVFRELISKGYYSFDSKQPVTSISRCRPGGDGKGYFAGYINFSTKYNNVLPVINEFRSMGGDSGQFDTLLRALEDYGSSNSGEVAGLGDFCDAWKAAAAAQPDTFVKAQKSAVDKMYGAVATRLAQDRGIRLSITKAALLDIAIVNGVGDGMNSIGAIVKRTDAAVVPADNNISGSKIRVNGKEVDEITWLETLMTKWVEANPSAQWRVDLFQMLLDDRRYSFDMKEPYTVKGYAGSIIFDCSAGTT
ncbi:hypothetical protein IWQ56_001172 [Coemansia nantahalensis]|nr:hypothetical protein IWQ56_001172 [Coemansia nantahalensis]